MHGSESRERLAGLLWSESSEEKARASLRQTVSDLKDRLAACDGTPFVADRLNVYLRLPLVQVDCTACVNRWLRGNRSRCCSRKSGFAESYLEGFDDLDPAFRTWLMIQRQCLHDDLVRQLEDMVAVQSDMSMLKRAGLALLNLDPTHELGCRAAMEASARLGDTAERAASLQGALGRSRRGVQLGAIREDAGSCFRDQDGSRGAAARRGCINWRVATGPAWRTERSLQRFQARCRFHSTRRCCCLSAHSKPAASRPRQWRRSASSGTNWLLRWCGFATGRCSTSTGNCQPTSGRPAFLIQATPFDDHGTLRFVLTLKDVASGRFIWSEQFSIDATGWYQTQQRMIRRIAISLDVSMSSERLTQVSNIPDLSLDQFDKWLKGAGAYFPVAPPGRGECRSAVPLDHRRGPALRSRLCRDCRHSQFPSPGLSRHLPRPGTACRGT